MNIGNYIQSYSEELNRKGYRQESIKNYTSCVSKFLGHFNELVTKPSEINEKDIKHFLGQFKEHNTQRAYHSAIKCFYKYVCRQPNKFKYIEYCKRNRRLPIVLAPDEMQAIIFAATNLKHKTILCLMYSTACRVGEVINLKLEDIDRKRMVINIRDAKGGKDRIVTLDPTFLDLLNEYITQYNPNTYLFNGQFDLKYSDRSIAQFLQKYATIAGVNKKVHPHLIRHTSATHLVEMGLDMSILQKLLGHSNISTTHLYGHISNTIISRITTPLHGVLKPLNLINDNTPKTIRQAS